MPDLVAQWQLYRDRQRTSAMCCRQLQVSDYLFTQLQQSGMISRSIRNERGEINALFLTTFAADVDDKFLNGIFRMDPNCVLSIRCPKKKTYVGARGHFVHFSTFGANHVDLSQ